MMVTSRTSVVKERRVVIVSGVHQGKAGWHVWDVTTPTGTRHVVQLDGGIRVRVQAVEEEF